ncbi:MAG: DUF5714 domain-containing protein [Clostridiales bacterium]|jgi:hypothetical protein|nr:DUF5714 domain-containing protein [Clostridiales bacterium]
MKVYDSGCFICGKPLNYHSDEKRLHCEICGAEAVTAVSCEGGHFICDKCHAQDAYGLITSFCLKSGDCSPVSIASELMKHGAIKMHGPEHHYLVAAALITAYKNAGGEIALKDCLNKALQRAANVPGGICGMWGACGAGIGAGIFASIVQGATPLSTDEWHYANLLTSEVLREIAKHGGPRCCKRNTYIALIVAIDFVATHFNIRLMPPKQEELFCRHFSKNNQCRKRDCLFYPSQKR